MAEKQIRADISALKTIEEIEVVSDEQKPVTPTRLSPEWSEYVLSQFADDEVVTKREVKGGRDSVNRYPKVDGLRRLFQVYIGEIIDSYPECIKEASINLDGSSINMTTYRYVVKYFRHDDKERLVRTAIEVADAFHVNQDFNNIDAPFHLFPSAIAATRAEARVYRKTLGLKVCSWDELPKQVMNEVAKQNQQVKAVNPDEVEKKFIDPGQINFLDTNCKRVDINPWKLLTSKHTFSNLKEVTYDVAKDYCKLLGDMVRGITNNKNVVKEYEDLHKTSLGKYNKNWQNNG